MTTNSENQQPATTQKLTDWQLFIRSHTARFLIVGLISLVLMIPLVQIKFLIEERQSRQQEVNDQLKSEWGGEIIYHGLAIAVPITEAISSVTTNGKNVEGKTTRTSYVHKTGYIFPEKSDDHIQSTVNERYRGIFKVNLFTATVHSTARFNLKALPGSTGQKTINWANARVVLLTNRDARFKEISDVIVDGRKMVIDNQVTAPENERLMVSSTPLVSLDDKKDCSFEVSVNAIINGSQLIRYQSLATKSSLVVSSNWKDPAFAGTSLPNNGTNISKKGFTANWNTMAIGNANTHFHTTLANQSQHAWSEIRFVSMVDQYQLNERTVKYGLLVLTLTFAVFFLIQIVGKVAIHPLHYFMIGLALLLFYSLLLSFSEQIGFIPAYLVASASIILLIVWYAKSVLQSLKFAVMSGLSLGLLYAFLLVIVNLEAYALIVGSIGLLLVLAAIMSVTRKINFDTI